jgi:hypothetical protein
MCSNDGKCYFPYSTCFVLYALDSREQYCPLRLFVQSVTRRVQVYRFGLPDAFLVLRVRKMMLWALHLASVLSLIPFLLILFSVRRSQLTRDDDHVALVSS